LLFDLFESETKSKPQYWSLLSVEFRRLQRELILKTTIRNHNSFRFDSFESH